MRTYRAVEASGEFEPEIIKADSIEGFEGFVEFYENRPVKTWPFGTTNYKYVVAVRQNVNVTDITGK